MAIQVEHSWSSHSCEIMSFVLEKGRRDPRKAWLPLLPPFALRWSSLPEVETRRTRVLSTRRWLRSALLPSSPEAPREAQARSARSLCGHLSRLVRLTQEAFEENDLSAMDAAEYGDVIYGIFFAIMAHTRIRNNFATILDSEKEWRKVCRSMERLRERPQSSAYARAAATRTSALGALP